MAEPAGPAAGRVQSASGALAFEILVKQFRDVTDSAALPLR